MRIILMITLLTTGPWTMAQDFYDYSKSDHVITLKSDKNEIKFSPYRVTESGIRERVVTRNGIDYHFVVLKKREGLCQEIVNQKGDTLATNWLSGKYEHSVITPDGSRYYLNKSRRQWTYTREGNDIITSSYQTSAGKKQFSIALMDPGLQNKEIWELIGLERGTDSLVRKSPIGVIVFSVILLNIVVFGAVNGFFSNRP